MSLTRKMLRELTMKMVYQYDVYPKKELDAQMDAFLENCEEPELPAEDGEPDYIYLTRLDVLRMTDAERAAVKARALDVFSKIRELDREIAGRTEGWKLNRIARVDLALIRLALYEIKYDDQVPEAAAINEAVELAKYYGTDESPRFVNGVLARLVRDPEAEEKTPEAEGKSDVPAEEAPQEKTED